MTATLNLTLRARAARCVRDANRGDDVLMMVADSEKNEALQLVGDSGVVVMTAREIRPRWREILKTGELGQEARTTADVGKLLANIMGKR